MCQQTLTAENSSFFVAYLQAAANVPEVNGKSFPILRMFIPSGINGEAFNSRILCKAFSKVVLFSTFLVNPQSERRMLIGMANIFLYFLVDAERFSVSS